jgi:hypothetical protein
VLIGLHLDWATDLGTFPTDLALSAGMAIGVQAGIDVVKLGANRLGGFAAIHGQLGGESGYGALTLGVAYRRF